MQTLLQYGADPRIYAEDGQTPAQQCSFEAVRRLLESWDISITENQLMKIEADAENRRQQQNQSAEMEVKKLEDEISSAEKEFNTLQKTVSLFFVVDIFI